MYTKEKIISELSNIFNNRIDFSKAKWWKIDTSFFHILQTLKNMNNNFFSIEKSIEKNKERYYLGSNHQRKLSFGAIHQYIRVGIFFDFFENCEELFSLNNKGLVEYALNKKIPFSKDLVNSYDFIEFLIRQNLHKKTIENFDKMDKKSPFYTTSINLLLSFYLYKLYSESKLGDNYTDAEKYFEMFKQKINSETNNWYTEYNGIIDLINIVNNIFKNENDGVSDTQVIERIQATNNELVGVVGEKLFDLLLANISKKRKLKFWQNFILI